MLREGVRREVGSIRAGRFSGDWTTSKEVKSGNRPRNATSTCLLSATKKVVEPNEKRYVNRQGHEKERNCRLAQRTEGRTRSEVVPEWTC